jgi:TrmH family RNA methyltransferase
MNPELLGNPKAERIRRVADLANAKARRRTGRFLVEGPQSVREAVACCSEAVLDLYVQADGIAGGELGAGAETDLAHEAQGEGNTNPTLTRARIVQAALRAGIYVHRAVPEVMRRISENAQGIAAVAELAALQPDPDAIKWSSAPTIAAFWQVRDPGNAGAIIRAADAAGCAAVVFVDECVDASNPKVVRSTAGSLFHVPLLTMGTEEFFTWCACHGCPVIAADVYGVAGHAPQSLPDVLREKPLNSSPKAVLFGNEARGLPESIVLRAQQIVSIPIYGRAESLNLATSAAVMLFSMAMSSHMGRM